jgi:hypothetical protein
MHRGVRDSSSGDEGDPTIAAAALQTSATADLMAAMLNTKEIIAKELYQVPI